MIQYYHLRNFDSCFREKGTHKWVGDIDPRGGQTIAMESIQPWFFETLQVGDFFNKRVGKARCSDEDNYCKKTGRELAGSRMKLTQLTVIRATLLNNNKVVVLEGPRHELYTLKHYKDTSRVYFVEYDG